MAGDIKPHMSLWSNISIIVGIVVGVTIFRAPSLIFNNVSTPWTGLMAWLLGGVLSIVGALCYAELATAYPKMGGDYVYLSRAFSPIVGFLFGWGRLTAIQTGSIGALAYVFADYANALLGFSADFAVLFAAGSVILLTLANIAGVKAGKNTQNALSIAKVVGLAVIVAVGLLFGVENAFEVANPIRGPGFGLAMILILYAYGGWNETAFVAAEMVDKKRDIPRALIFGTGAVTLIYLLVNIAYITALGFEGLRGSSVPAADILGKVLGGTGVMAMSILVILSVLGALNGTILTGARVNVAIGKDYSIFAALCRWSGKYQSPVAALVVQGIVSLLMIVSVGTVTGRSLLDRFAVAIGFGLLPWDNYGGGFDTLVSATAPVFWLFFLLTGVSLFILRFMDKNIERPFKVPLFPLTPLLFCSTCIYMLYSSLTYAKGLSLFGLIPLIVGIPLYFISGKAADSSFSFETLESDN